MDVQIITASLTSLRKLETKKYVLERFRTEILKSQQKIHSTSYDNLQVPKYNPPQKPINPNVEVGKGMSEWLPWLCSFFAVVFFLAIYGSQLFVESLGLLLFFLLGAIFFAIASACLYVHRDAVNEEKENNQNLINEYNSKLRVYEQSKEKYDRDYANQKKYIEETNENRLMLREHNQRLSGELEKTLINVNDSIDKISVLIDDLYNNVDLFPKYRNLIAVSSISEYFESGRCSSLTDNDGAYNLYEQEIRQNRIIQQLDQVIESLINIKNNQFYLYQAITMANSQINSLSLNLCNLGEVLNNVGKIAALSADYAKEAYKIASEPKTIVGFVG